MWAGIWEKLGMTEERYWKAVIRFHERQGQEMCESCGRWFDSWDLIEPESFCSQCATCWL